MTLSLNKQKEKEWYNVIKQQAKAKEWRFKGWFSYKTVNNFFYQTTFYISAIDNSAYGSLEFKPLIIDETFWKIVDLVDNKNKPLSFRGDGAFVVSSIDVLDFNLKVVPETLKEDIYNLFDRIDLMINDLSCRVSDIDHFVKYIENNPSKRSEWVDSDLLIVCFIIQKNYDKALSLLDYAKKTRGICNWNFGEKDFYDLAVEYCNNHLK